MNKFKTNPLSFVHWHKDKESFGAFVVKAALALSILLGLGHLFFARYSFAFDPQSSRCIPGYSFYIIDHRDIKIERGALYAFYSKDLSPILPEGIPMIKFLKGMPGDQIEINPYDQIIINGKPDVFGLSLAESKFGRDASTFRGRTTLKANEYWFLGTSTASFDSRYWGAIRSENIIGRAHPIM